MRLARAAGARSSTPAVMRTGARCSEQVARVSWWMAEETSGITKLVLENAEAVVKSLLNDELLKSIPYVQNAFAMLDVGRSVSDRILSAKLSRMFQTLQSVPDEERNSMCQRLLSSGEDAE